MAFERGRELNGGQEVCTKGAKTQELDENSKEFPNTIRESQKLSQSQTEYFALKI